MAGGLWVLSERWEGKTPGVLSRAERKRGGSWLQAGVLVRGRSGGGGGAGVDSAESVDLCWPNPGP